MENHSEKSGIVMVEKEWLLAEIAEIDNLLQFPIVKTRFAR
jgi:hypothetical protein